jgi:hypothetical protein
MGVVPAEGRLILRRAGAVDRRIAPPVRQVAAPAVLAAPVRFRFRRIS